MKLVLILAAFAVFASVRPASAQIQDIVDKFQKCRVEVGTWLNGCVTDLWMDVRPSLIFGTPELGLPPIDPLRVARMELPARGLLKGKATFEDMTVTGLRNYEVRASTVDLVERTIVLKMFIPVLIIEGKYGLEVTAFSLPIKGDGLFAVKLTGVDNIIRMVVDRDKGSSTDAALRLDKLDMSFDAKNITFRLENLLGGGAVGIVVNNLINANSHLLLDSIKPQLSEKLVEALVDIATAVVEMIPADILNK